jgi:hypothetical protein
MLTRRRVPLVLALAAVGGAAGASAQPASALSEAHYLAKFDATFHATFDEPRHMTYRDCYRTWNHESGGEETWHVWSTGTNKVRVTSNGTSPQLQFGAFGYSDDLPHSGLVGKGTRVRSRHEATTFTAGSCGVLQEPMMDPPKPTDCGTRMINYEIQLVNKGTEITPDVLQSGNGIREKLGFDNCSIPMPENVLEGSWPAVSATLMSKGKPVRSFFGSQETLTATGKWSTDGKRDLEWGGVLTGNVTVNWKLTLTRVSAKAPKKRSGGRRR